MPSVIFVLFPVIIVISFVIIIIFNNMFKFIDIVTYIVSYVILVDIITVFKPI